MIRQVSSDESEKSKKAKIETEENCEKLKNPHCLQNRNFKYCEFSHLSRKINENTKREKYRRRKNEDKSTFHFGQRKLLLSEIEFMNICSNEIIEKKLDKKIVFIYAGAASGIHIPILMNMFPFIEKYILVDPAKFHFDKNLIDKTIKYQVINECFTNEMAREMRDTYADCEILFVSDIRTANYRILTRNVTELKVEQDMIDQMRWYRILNPFKCMLKFRLPYVGNDKLAKTSIEYLDGEVYFQTWEGKTSSETRLIVNKNAPMKTYDCIEYEDILFRFNTVERVMGYKHDIIAPGIDHCYDCRAEVFIIEEYLNLRQKIIEYFNCKRTHIFSKQTTADIIVEINLNLNADKKTDELTVTLNGEQTWYSIHFTDIHYGANLNELFNRDCITMTNTRNSSSDEMPDDEKEKLEIHKKMCKSPHILQNRKYFDVIGEENFEKFRFLNEDYPQMVKPKYMSTDFTTIYFKERSLRLCEIEFLTKVCLDLIESNNFKNKKLVCIYAGSAASKRIDLLSKMFPFIKFILFDPKKFDIEPSKLISIKQEYLTENIALDLSSEYNDWIKVFISNIKRSGNLSNPDNLKLDKEDLSLQTSVHFILKPFKSMLRFTIPFSKDSEFRYLDGDILFRPWSHKSSFDCVLILDEKSKFKNYNYHKFKNQMFRFNNVNRVLTYEHDVRALGIDCCYDCRCEVYIMDKYLRNSKLICSSFGKDSTNDDWKTAKDLITDLNYYLNAEKINFRVQFNNLMYSIAFTDIEYEKKFEKIFNEKTLCSKKNENDSVFSRLKF